MCAQEAATACVIGKSSVVKSVVFVRKELSYILVRQAM